MFFARTQDTVTLFAVAAGRSILSAVSPRVALAVAAGALFCGTSALAQLSGKGELKGTVKDPTGAVVANATVTATEDTTGVNTVRKSTSAGDYDLSPLDPGVYTVVVTATGFQKQTQANVHVNALEIQDYSPVLTLGAMTENVTVTTAPPALETSNAVLGATMEQEMYSALPIQMGAGGNFDQRRATDFAVLMPGVQGNETNGNSTTNTGVVNGSGSRGAASAVYLNGLPFTSVAGEGDTRYVWSAISVDSVDQFQVQTSGYSALYEGQGVQNYTVKSGGSKFHGSVYDFFRNTALDTWGFFAPALSITNPATGIVKPATKPTEHENEFGIVASGPVYKNKVFLFANYDGYRFSHGPTPVYQTLPTLAEVNGDFRDQGVNIYDPRSTVCNAGGTACTRTQYASDGTNVGIPVGTLNVIPRGLQDPVALKMQSFLQADYTLPTTIGNNFIGGYKYGLSNWMTTSKMDWTINSRNSLSLTFGKGRQASVGPAAQTTAGRNVTPFAPYNYGQVYAPKTTVWTLQETYVITPRLVNQFNYGFGRYNGPTFNPNSGGAFSATSLGISGLPSGQASTAFPITTFSGTNAPTGFAGTVANTAISNAYIITDNVQWQLGKHSLTIGGQYAWLEYQYLTNATGTSPLTIANAPGETEAFTCKVPFSNGAPCPTASQTTTLNSATGFSYASFLAGAADSQSVTDNLAIVETGARFHPVSPYVQDDWKVSSRLTLNLGLRWDFYPTYREEHDRLSYFNPAGANPVSMNLGTVAYAGSSAGAAGCNCRTNVSDFYKNFGPRLGFAFQSDPKTVWRGSWGVMYTHGNGVGGSAISRAGTGTSGYSSTPKTTFTNTIGNSTLPAFTNQFLTAGFQGFNPPPTLPNLISGFGTGYYIGGPSPQTIAYGDSYLGGRAPQYLNWSFGMQRSLSNSITLTMSYVGSEGHFEINDGGNARGQWVNQLNPAFLAAGATALSAKATPANVATAVALAGMPVPNYNAATFDPNQSVSTALKPFPQYSLSDAYGNVANSVYHGLQATVQKRLSNGLIFMANYTWSKAIDDGGTFRSGYAIPARFIQTAGRSWAVDRIERSVSTSSQPQHIVVTGVYDLPFGKGHLGGSNLVTRSLLSNFKVSGIVQMYSGSPLAITESSSTTCTATNPATGTCMPNYAPGLPPNYTAKLNGDFGHGVTAATASSRQFINPNVFAHVSTVSIAAAPLFGNLVRTAPYGLYGPGNYDLDLSIRRTFGLGFEGAHLMLEADLYNITNHTQFGGIGTAFGSTTFGTVSTQANTSRDAQLTAKVEF
jgi:hypothetical protein